MTTVKKTLKYIIPVILGFIIGFISHQFQVDSIQNWYPYLNKPGITPPNWVFPMVWGFIYTISGISMGLILNTLSDSDYELTFIWGTQLLLNFTWSIFFFYFRYPLIGIINILLLDVVVIWYIFKSYRVKKAASILFYFYIIWLIFATYLNFYIMLNN